MQRRLIVDRDLLATVNVTQGNEENVVIEDLHITVGLTGMVNVMRAVSTFAAIKAPAVIDRADAEPTAIGSALGFPIRDPFTCVLCYFSATTKAEVRKATLPFNRRALYFQARRKLEFHSSILALRR